MDLTTDQKKISRFSPGRSAMQFLENGMLMAFIAIQALAISLGIAAAIVKLFESFMSRWP